MLVFLVFFLFVIFSSLYCERLDLHIRPPFFFTPASSRLFANVFYWDTPLTYQIRIRLTKRGAMWLMFPIENCIVILFFLRGLSRRRGLFGIRRLKNLLNKWETELILICRYFAFFTNPRTFFSHFSKFKSTKNMTFQFLDTLKKTKQKKKNTWATKEINEPNCTLYRILDYDPVRFIDSTLNIPITIIIVIMIIMIIVVVIIKINILNGRHSIRRRCHRRVFHFTVLFLSCF